MNYRILTDAFQSLDASGRAQVVFPQEIESVKDDHCRKEQPPVDNANHYYNTQTHQDVLEKK